MHTNLTGLEYELYDYKERRKSRGWKAVICFGVWLLLFFLTTGEIKSSGSDREMFHTYLLLFETVGTLAFILTFIYLIMYGTANRHVKKISKFINMQRGAQVEKDKT